MSLKYKPGDTIICLKSERGGFIKNKEYEVEKSIKYPSAYAFKGKPDHGWCKEFVENPKYFELFVILSWRKRLGGM